MLSQAVKKSLMSTPWAGWCLPTCSGESCTWRRAPALLGSGFRVQGSELHCAAVGDSASEKMHHTASLGPQPPAPPTALVVSLIPVSSK